MALSIPIAAKIASIGTKFGKFVIERWTIYRREQFFEAFLENVQIEQASGIRNEEVDEVLNRLLENELTSEVLYDAYRRVCFSKTKKYGPRIIGLLTAELVNNASTSDDDDEMVFMAAELLGDVDFARFRRVYQSLLDEVSTSADPKSNVTMAADGEITSVMRVDSREAGTDSGDALLLTPTDLRISHGSWAALLESCGFINRFVEQQTQNLKEDTERYIDYDQSWIVTTSTVVYRPATKRLFELLNRADINSSSDDTQ